MLSLSSRDACYKKFQLYARFFDLKSPCKYHSYRTNQNNGDYMAKKIEK